MNASAGVPAIDGEWTNRHLLFARQPEPDLEFTEDDLDDTTPPPAPPMKEPRQSGKRPLLWIVLLLLLGGIGYVAMDPDGAMQLVAPYLEDGQEAAQRPAPQMPSRATVPSRTTEASAPAPMTAQATPPATPALTAPPTKAASPVLNVAGPLFSEGQRVTVVTDPTRPKSPVPLFVDSAGTKTSVMLPASTTLIVLDGDYQNNVWVYAVRTNDGRKGWIPERNLKRMR